MVSKNMEKKEIVVVLGMHRSGTSAITRSLKVLGVDLGGRLLPAEAGINDKGFWEDVDITAFNVDLLHALGHDWHTLTQPMAVCCSIVCRAMPHFIRVAMRLKKPGNLCNQS